MAVPNKRNVLNGFEVYRERILSLPWIKGINIDEVREHLAGLENNRFASIQYKSSHLHPYIQPRGGFPLFKQQKNLSESLDKAGADFIPLTIDSYTRHNDYDKVSPLLKKSEKKGTNYLNGYPLVNHGYKCTRKLYKNIKKPVCLRHGTPDARLLVEMAIASGITEIEGGAFTYTIPYSKNFPIDQAIIYWQYVDRLCDHYSTSKRLIHRESFGPLTATMVPPMMMVAIELVEMLLAAEQGIKSFSVGFSQTGSITQDIALGQILKQKTKEYLKRFGFNDVKVYLVYHQWMGAFPADRKKASELINFSAMIAKLVKADKIVTKTKDEAFGIPTIEANCEAVRNVRHIFEKLNDTGVTENESIAAEAELIFHEVDYLMDTIFDIPGDVFWESAYQAFRCGFLDVPFAPHCMNKNDMLTLRDRFNSIRIKEPGMVPIDTKDLKQEHKLLKTNQDAYSSFVDKAIKDINIMI